MMGSFLTRVSVMIFGYAYPAYECYKTVELNKPEIEQLLFWCQYWILVAVLAAFERVGDVLISWLPLYGEVKLAFFIYLWHPKTMGTTYIYSKFFQPYMSKHEQKIDRSLLEMRTRAADLASLYWQKALRNGRSWFFVTLQHVASQPSIVPRPIEEPPQAQHSAASSSPKQTEQTITKSPQPNPTEQTKLVMTHKPEEQKAKTDNSPSSSSSASPDPTAGHGGHSSRSSTSSSSSSSSSSSHHPSPHNEIPVQENLTPTINHNSSSPRSEETKQEEPMRIFRRPRIKKRVTTTFTSIH